jgi:hypothetical protein
MMMEMTGTPNLLTQQENLKAISIFRKALDKE